MVKKNIDNFPNKKTYTIDVKNRKVLILNDLHLFSKWGGRGEVGKLKLIHKILKDKIEVVILNGDIFDLAARPVLELEKKFSKLDKNDDFYLLIKEIQESLKNKETILISGNHDSQKAYGDFYQQFSKIMVDKLKIITNRGTGFITHGDKIASTFAIADKVEDVSNFFVRSFSFIEAIILVIFGNLRFLFGKTMKKYRRSLPDIKVKYESDFVFLAHSHIPEVDSKNGLFVGGVGQHGRIEYFVIGKSGKINFKRDWYNSFFESIDKIRQKICLKK